MDSLFSSPARPDSYERYHQLALSSVPLEHLSLGEQAVGYFSSPARPDSMGDTTTSSAVGLKSPADAAGSGWKPGRLGKATLTRVLSQSDASTHRTPATGAHAQPPHSLARQLYSRLLPTAVGGLEDSDDERPITAPVSPPPPTRSPSSPAWFHYSEEGVELLPPPRSLAPRPGLVDAELLRHRRELRTGGCLLTLGGRCIGDASIEHWTRRISALLDSGALSSPLTLELASNDLGPSGVAGLLEALLPPTVGPAAGAALGGLVLSANPLLAGALPGGARGGDFDRFAGGFSASGGLGLPGASPPQAAASARPGLRRDSPRLLPLPASAALDASAAAPLTSRGRTVAAAAAAAADPRGPPPWAPLGPGVSAWLPRLVSHVAAPGSRLVVLELDGLRLGQGGVGSLCRALAASPPPPLQALSLGDCGVSEGAGGGLAELCWLLAAPTCRLVELALHWNELGAAAAAPLARALAVNQSLHAVSAWLWRRAAFRSQYHPLWSPPPRSSTSRGTSWGVEAARLGGAPFRWALLRAPSAPPRSLPPPPDAAALLLLLLLLRRLLPPPPRRRTSPPSCTPSPRTRGCSTSPSSTAASPPPTLPRSCASPRPSRPSSRAFTSAATQRGRRRTGASGSSTPSPPPLPQSPQSRRGGGRRCCSSRRGCAPRLTATLPPPKRPESPSRRCW